MVKWSIDRDGTDWACAGRHRQTGYAAATASIAGGRLRGDSRGNGQRRETRSTRAQGLTQVCSQVRPRISNDQIAELRGHLSEGKSWRWITRATGLSPTTISKYAMELNLAAKPTNGRRQKAAAEVIPMDDCTVDRVIGDPPIPTL